MGHGNRTTIDALLAEGDWLQRLAQRLVAEPHAAADAAQEALVVALERPPEADIPLRRWLAGVLRNVVRQGRRRDGRRRVREVSRELPDDPEGTDELAVRLELHQRLIRCVRELEEPYRSTLALRYLEDLTPAEIARRQGVPTKTVYTRLERALAQLRARLDREHGGSRSAWALVLVPDLRAGAAALPTAILPTTLAHLTAMTTLKWTAAAAATLLLGFVGVQALRSSPDTPRAHDVAAAPPAQLAQVTAPNVEERTPSTETRVAVASPEAPQETPLPSADVTASALLAGFVLHLDGQPVEGAVVRYGLPFGAQGEPANASAVATSDTRGAFALPAPTSAVSIVAEAPGLATVLPPTVLPMPRTEPVRVWVGPAVAVAGEVVDPDGRPLEGAALDIRLPAEVQQRLNPGVFSAGVPAWRTQSDAEGRFSFPAVGALAGAGLEASLDGHVNARHELSGASEHEVLLVLHPTSADTRPIAGVVRRPDGTPVAGAHVGFLPAEAYGFVEGRLTMEQGEPTVTDANGRFGMHLPEHLEWNPERAPWLTLRVVAEGLLPVELQLGELQPAQLGNLEVVLDSEALRISGTVVDASGAAVVGARVWTRDGVDFGSVREEHAGTNLLMHRSVEELLADGDGRSAHTDTNGRFELRGLLARDYRILVQHPRTLEIAGPDAYAAGATDLRLVVGGREHLRRVAGRVVDAGGNPLENVRIFVDRSGVAADGSIWRAGPFPSSKVLTDTDGRFVFEELSIAGTVLQVGRSSHPRASRIPLAQHPDLEAIEIVLPTACDVRIELDDPNRATSFHFVDAAGQAVPCTVQSGGILIMSDGLQLNGGRSDLVQADDSAVELLLIRGVEVAERIPVRLKPGELNVLRP